MVVLGSDSEEDLVSYGMDLEPLEGERPKKPIPLQDQTVRDEKGRYKQFHGAFSGGFSAGYFNIVDFIEEEDLTEFGIAPKAIVTMDDFASETKDRI
uniref:G patch domain-containing protein n=1 Tax=Lynx canadensis TaxID=61383 RepID=A0A667HRE5_LYNCA